MEVTGQERFEDKCELKLNGVDAGVNETRRALELLSTLMNDGNRLLVILALVS